MTKVINLRLAQSVLNVRPKIKPAPQKKGRDYWTILASVHGGVSGQNGGR